MLLEVCCSSFADVQNAVAGGARRIELCVALGEDGLTPSIGLLKTVRRHFPDLLVYVLIRPREGDFVYNDADKEIIYSDIRHCVAAGADGIVCGALTPEGDIDTEAVREMLRCCDGKPFTFHRAFDVCRNPLQALSVLKDMGVDRILTSGQQPSAVEGIALLRQLIAEAQGSPVIMPGGGVNSGHVRRLIEETGAVEVHGSCRKGTANTDSAEVARILQLLNP